MALNDLQSRLARQAGVAAPLPPRRAPFPGRPPGRPSLPPGQHPLPLPLVDAPPIQSRERIERANRFRPAGQRVTPETWTADARDCLKPGGDYWTWNMPSRAHWVMAMWDLALEDGIEVPVWFWKQPENESWDVYTGWLIRDTATRGGRPAKNCFCPPLRPLAPRRNLQGRLGSRIVRYGPASRIIARQTGSAKRNQGPRVFLGGKGGWDLQCGRSGGWSSLGPLGGAGRQQRAPTGPQARPKADQGTCAQARAGRLAADRDPIGGRQIDGSLGSGLDSY